jgi:CRISPR-associated endonuclease/helicase Cas3
LAGGKEADSGGDVEGAVIEEREASDTGRRAAVLWRGRDQSVLTDEARDLRPYDVLVAPAGAQDVDGFGDTPPDSDGLRLRDVGDRAFLQARDRPMLRVHSSVLEPWARHSAVTALLRWAAAEDRDEDEGDLSDLLAELGKAEEAATLDEVTTVAPPPGWLRDAARALASKREVIRHPCGGYVLTSRARIGAIDRPEEEASADEDDLTSEAPGAVPLREHLHAVAAVARRFVRHCLPEDTGKVVVRAAELHDLGKADWRFQVMLHRGNEIEAFRRGKLLAKSDGVPGSLAARRRARQLARLPVGFRHEMLSVQLVEGIPEFSQETDPDLVLHLIASHHGHGRPFAPVVLDNDPPDVDLADLDIRAALSAEDRGALVPPHRLDSGIAERFWRLTRRFGWWGLAYLEAILRLADWEASEHHEDALPKAGRNSAEDVA